MCMATCLSTWLPLNCTSTIAHVVTRVDLCVQMCMHMWLNTWLHMNCTCDITPVVTCASSHLLTGGFTHACTRGWTHDSTWNAHVHLHMWSSVFIHVCVHTCIHVRVNKRWHINCTCHFMCLYTSGHVRYFAFVDVWVLMCMHMWLNTWFHMNCTCAIAHMVTRVSSHVMTRVFTRGCIAHVAKHMIPHEFDMCYCTCGNVSLFTCVDPCVHMWINTRSHMNCTCAVAHVVTCDSSNVSTSVFTCG